MVRGADIAALILIACFSLNLAFRSETLVIEISLLIFSAMLLIGAYLDWVLRRAPHWLSLSVLGAGFVFALLNGPEALGAAAAGALLMGGLLFAAQRRFFRSRGIHGLGTGDVVYLSAVSAWLGPFGALLMLGGGSALALALGPVLKEKRLPLVSTAALVALALANIEPAVLWSWGAGG